MAFEAELREPEKATDLLTKVEPKAANESRKRGVYLLVLGLGALGSSAGLLADRSSATPSAALAALWGLTAAMLVVLAAAAHSGRLSVRRLEQLLLTSSTLLGLGSLAYWSHLAVDPRAAVVGVMLSLHWMPLLFVFSFVAYRGRFALAYALALLAAVVLITATAPPREAVVSPYLGGFSGLVQVYLTYLGLIVCLTYFSHLSQRASAVEAEARSLRRLAHTDALTGLANRRHMEMVMHKELQRAARYDRGFALIMLDIDGFKEVNDRHGHQVGDRVLVDLADRVLRKVRTADTVARWGGEEFIILAPETSLEDALRMAESLRAEIATQRLGGQRLTVSIGVASSQPEDDEASLLARVDAALYRAKEEGRNLVR